MSGNLKYQVIPEFNEYTLNSRNNRKNPTRTRPILRKLYLLGPGANVQLYYTLEPTCVKIWKRAGSWRGPGPGRSQLYFLLWLASQGFLLNPILNKYRTGTAHARCIPMSQYWHWNLDNMMEIMCLSKWENGFVNTRLKATIVWKLFQGLSNVI